MPVKKKQRKKDGESSFNKWIVTAIALMSIGIATGSIMREFTVREHLEACEKSNIENKYVYFDRFVPEFDMNYRCEKKELGGVIFRKCEPIKKHRKRHHRTATKTWRLPTFEGEIE